MICGIVSISYEGIFFERFSIQMDLLQTISQRFTPNSAKMFYQIMQRLAEVQLESEKVDIPLLKRFSAVIVEDSSYIPLPDELVELWQGSRYKKEMGKAGVKAFAQWNVISWRASWSSINRWFNQ